MTGDKAFPGARRAGPPLKVSLPPVQMAAPTLNVTKDGDTYSLRWVTEKMYYSHIENTFEIQYRTAGDRWEVST